MVNHQLKTYMYVLLEGIRPVSGFTVARSAMDVYEDIYGNFHDPDHIVVQEVPELIPRLDDMDEWTGGFIKA